MSIMLGQIKPQQSQQQSQEEEDLDNDDKINFQQIQYNQLIFQAYQAFQNKELNPAIKYYTDAMELLNPMDYDRKGLILSNLSIIYFYNCEYKKAGQCLEQAKNAIESQPQRDAQRNALLVKIYSNTAIVKIVLNQFDDALLFNELAMNVIRTASEDQQQDLMQELIYIYFRFISFEQMGDGYFENVEQKYDGSTLACFYSNMGLNRELMEDNDTAYKYYQQSYEKWQQVQEPGFLVLTLKHLLNLSQILSKSDDTQTYQQQLKKYLEFADFQGINQDALFKDWDKKINIAKKITKNVYQLEKEILNKLQLKQPSQQKNFSSTLNQSVFNLFEGASDEQQKKNLIYQALKLRLQQSAKASQELLQSQSLNNQQKDMIFSGVQQLRETIRLLNNDKYSLIEKQILNSQYAKQAVTQLKSAINKIRKYYVHLCYYQAFQQIKKGSANGKQNQIDLKTTNLKPTQPVSMYPDKSKKGKQKNVDLGLPQENTNPQNLIKGNQTPPQIDPDINLNPQQQPSMISSKFPSNQIQQRLQAHLTRTANGEYLTKYNVHNQDKHPKFFKITNQFLLYATNDKAIKDQGKTGYYNFKDIKGIVLGKVSDVMSRPSYKNLDPSLCFSLFMQKRTLDIYATREQIDPWFISLSIQINRFNKQGYCLKIGKYYWRKLFLKLYHYFILPLLAKGAQINLCEQFPRALVLFKNNSYKLPGEK